MSSLNLRSKTHTKLNAPTHIKHTLTYDCLCLSVYEDEDLRELRASMERLLQEQHSEDDDDEEEEDDGGGSNGSPADEEAAVLNGLASAVDDKCSPEEECFNKMAEEEDDVSHGEEEPGGPVTNGMEDEEDEEQNSSEGQLNEEWQSGNAITTASINNYSCVSTNRAQRMNTSSAKTAQQLTISTKST